MLWPWTSTGKKRKEEGPGSDATLAGQLKQRDQSAFLSLYDRYHRSVYRFLMHMTGSVAVAEECTQEVFVVILDSMCTGAIGQFDPAKGTLEGYLLGIARNLARRERHRGHRLLSLDSALESPEGDRLFDKFCEEKLVWDVAAQLAARSELQVLYGAILELPAHYREVIVLCSLQEKSYQEAAAILQCSEGTIASRMNRAKALLAAKLRRSVPDRMKASAS